MAYEELVRRYQDVARPDRPPLAPGWRCRGRRPGGVRQGLRRAGAVPARVAVPAVAAADRRQRGAQPPPLGRPTRGPRAPGRRGPPAGRRGPIARGGGPRRRAPGRAARTRSTGSATRTARSSAARYFLDLSEAEAAETLGLPRGTVKSRLSRALGRLREQLAAADGGPSRWRVAALAPARATRTSRARSATSPWAELPALPAREAGRPDSRAASGRGSRRGSRPPRAGAHSAARLGVGVRPDRRGLVLAIAPPGPGRDRRRDRARPARPPDHLRRPSRRRHPVARRRPSAPAASASPIAAGARRVRSARPGLGATVALADAEARAGFPTCSCRPTRRSGRPTPPV